MMTEETVIATKIKLSKMQLMHYGYIKENSTRLLSELDSKIDKLIKEREELQRKVDSAPSMIKQLIKSIEELETAQSESEFQKSELGRKSNRLVQLLAQLKSIKSEISLDTLSPEDQEKLLKLAISIKI